MANAKTVTTKQDLIWYQVLFYLEDMTSTGALKDEEFAVLYNQLLNFVDDKLKLTHKGEITDIYVVVEQEEKY